MIVHQVGEGLFAAGHMLGQGDAGIVARLDNQAFQQIFDTHPLVDLDEHPRAGRLPCLFADQHLVACLDRAAAQLLEHQVGGHDLGQAGRFKALLGVACGEHRVAVHVDQQVTGGGDRWRCRCRRRARQAEWGEQQAQGEAGDDLVHVTTFLVRTFLIGVDKDTVSGFVVLWLRPQIPTVRFGRRAKPRVVSPAGEWWSG